MPTNIAIKKLNTERMRTALKLIDYGTKISLSAATGLSVATCGNILHELILTGEVIEIALSTSTGGRPSKQFMLNADYIHVLCLYPRKEGKQYSINYAIADLRGKLTQDTSLFFEQITRTEIVSVIQSMINSDASIKAISLGIPGVIINGVIVTCDFEFLSGLPIKQYLEDQFNINVTIENDVNATSLGFYIRQQQTIQPNCNVQPIRKDSLVYIYYPIEGGPGAGIIIDGAILHGSTNYAGEVSNIPFGLSCDEQAQLQKNSENFFNYVANTILAINCILNPKTIILSGLCFDMQAIDSITRLIATNLSSVHMPIIHFEKDFHQSYLNGLVHLGLSSLIKSRQIIEGLDKL